MSVKVIQHLSPAPMRSACETISLASDGASKCAEIFVTNNADKWTFFCAYCQMATVDIGAFICHIRLEHLNKQISETHSKNSTTIAASLANVSNLSGVMATTQNVEAEEEFVADAQQQPQQNEIIIKQEVTSNEEKLQSFGSENDNLLANKIDIGKHSTTIAASVANVSNLTGVMVTTQNVEAEDEFMADAQQQPQQNEITIKQEVISNQDDLQSFGFEKENFVANKLSIMAEESEANFNNLFQNTSNLTAVQQVIHAESLTFQGMLTKFSKVIEPMFMRLTNEVNSLRQEINSMCSEFKELKKDKFEVKLVIPNNPFKIMDEFLNFENLLQEDKLFLKSFEKELLTVAKTPNFTKNCWRKLLTDELAEHLCWKGTAEKMCVRSLSVARAIRNAAISIGVGEGEFVKSTKSFFQFAKSRQESRKKYVDKKLSL